MGKGLSGEAWGWEGSHLLTYFYCGEGRLLGRRESPELQLCWGWEGAAKLNGGLILEPSSWEGLFLESRAAVPGLRQPRVRVRAEGKRKPGCAGLQTSCNVN